MLAFTIVTGLIGAVSLLIQLWDRFPSWKPYLEKVTYVSVGMILGLATRVVAETEISLPRALSAVEALGVVLFGGAGILIAFFWVVHVFSETDARSRRAWEAAQQVTSGLGFLLVFLMSTFFGRGCL